MCTHTSLPAGHPWIRNYNNIKVPLDILIFKLMKPYMRSSPLRKAALRVCIRLCHDNYFTFLFLNVCVHIHIIFCSTYYFCCTFFWKWTFWACLWKAMGFPLPRKQNPKGWCQTPIFLTKMKIYLKSSNFIGDLFCTKWENIMCYGNGCFTSTETALHKCALRVLRLRKCALNGNGCSNLLYLYSRAFSWWYRLLIWCTRPGWRVLQEAYRSEGSFLCWWPTYMNS